MPMAAMSRGREPRLRERLARDTQLRRADLARVVLDPAGLREELPELALRDRHGRAAALEQDRARAGRALVEGEDVGHGRRRLA